MRILFTAALLFACSRSEELTIAWVGPLSGPEASEGKSAVRGIQIYLEEQAKLGRKIKLDTYDDQNDPVRAASIAEQIAGSDAIAVIGHHSAACSTAGAGVYRQRGIAAVTAVTTAELGDSYFRTIQTDDMEGAFLAHYAARLSKTSSITVIHDRERSHARIAELVVDTWNRMPGRIALAIDEVTPESIETAIRAGAPIILALSAQPAAEVVRGLREARFSQPIIGTRALSSPAFLTAFDGDPSERSNPGQITNGIYVTSPFLFDIGGERAAAFRRSFTDAYGDLPGWIELFSYDAAKLIGDSAVGEGDVTARRAKLREALGARGAPVKPIAMAVLRGRSLEVALLQLRLEGDAFVPTDVVLTGVRVNELFEIAVDEGRFEADIYVWLRHRSGFDAGDLIIVNAVDGASLGEPIAKSDENGVSYSAYRFRPKLSPDHFAGGYGEHILGIGYRHRTLPRERLIFARDSIGMGVQTAQTNADRLRQIERLLDPDLGWALRRVVFFEDTAVEHSIGNPRYLERAKKTIDYSRYNIGLAIVPSALTLRRSLPLSSATWLFPISGVALLIVILLNRFQIAGNVPKTRFVLQLIAAIALLVASEIYLGELLIQTTGRRYEKLLKMLFDVLWWIAPAALVNGAIKRFVWQPLEEQTERAVPTILRLFVSFTVYLLAFFGVVAFVFDQKLTSLLATSGVFAMIIGLAIQINIANIFSGIALNLERPFRIGDWIMVHGRTPSPEHSIIGCVSDINWRTTRLRTTSNTVVIIPNGQISERTITNFMIPTEVSRFELLFPVDQSVPSADVIRTIYAALAAVTGTEHDGPLADPPPKVRIDMTTPDGVLYSVRYYIVPREVSPSKARHTICESVLEHLRQAGIALAPPKREIVFKKIDGPPIDLEV